METIEKYSVSSGKDLYLSKIYNLKQIIKFERIQVASVIGIYCIYKIQKSCRSSYCQQLSNVLFFHLNVHSNDLNFINMNEYDISEKMLHTFSKLASFNKSTEK